MPENLTDADEVVILEDDEFTALCDRLTALHPEAAGLPPAVLLAFAKLVLGFARLQRAEANRESLSALREAFAALDSISGPRLTPALRIGSMATTLGNTRCIVRSAILKTEADGREAHFRDAASYMLSTLRDMDKWLANTNHDTDHPWRISIRSAIDRAEGRA